MKPSIKKVLGDKEIHHKLFPIPKTSGQKDTQYLRFSSSAS